MSQVEITFTGKFLNAKERIMAAVKAELAEYENIKIVSEDRLKLIVEIVTDVSPRR